MALPAKKALMAVTALALVVGAVMFWRMSGGDLPREDVHVYGNIEVTEAEVSFRIPGRLAQRRASEGQRVEAGQTLALLDDVDLRHDEALRAAELDAALAALAALEAGSRPEEIAQARAERDRAHARLDDLLAGARPEELAALTATAEAAHAEVARAGLEVERAQLERDRQATLAGKDFVPRRDLDNADTALSSARAAAEAALAREREAQARLALLSAGARADQVVEARSALARAEEALRLIQKGPRREEIDQARARAALAREALAASRTRLSHAVALAPLSGLVLSHAVEPGEYVSAGTPVLTVGDLSTVRLRAYVPEPDLPRVRVGAKARVRADSGPSGGYEGVVTFLSSEAEFTPRAVQTQRERVKLVYRVKIDIHNDGGALKPGMPAEAVIEVP